MLIYRAFLFGVVVVVQDEIINLGSAGDCLFRPSSKGTSSIVCMLKLHGEPGDGVVVSVDIQERRKVQKADGSWTESEKKLGETGLGDVLYLTFQNQQMKYRYEDLDEVVASFVDPLCAAASDVVAHRKFEAGPEDQVKDILRGRLSNASHSIPADYAIGVSRLHEGYFFLAYAIRSKHHPEEEPKASLEYFQWIPTASTATGKAKGPWYFRKTPYHNLDDVINAFKREPISKEHQRASRTTAAVQQHHHHHHHHQQQQQQYAAPQMGGMGGHVYGRDGPQHAPPPPRMTAAHMMGFGGQRAPPDPSRGGGGMSGFVRATGGGGAGGGRPEGPPGPPGASRGAPPPPTWTPGHEGNGSRWQGY